MEHKETPFAILKKEDGYYKARISRRELERLLFEHNRLGVDQLRTVIQEIGDERIEKIGMEKIPIDQFVSYGGLLPFKTESIMFDDSGILKNTLVDILESLFKKPLSYASVYKARDKADFFVMHNLGVHNLESKEYVISGLTELRILGRKWY